MSGFIAKRLSEMGVVLPTVTAPIANYRTWTRTGDLVIISGQLPILEGAVTVKGHLGDTVMVADGIQAARTCALNLLAQLSNALDGDLDRVRQVVRLGGFIASAPGFTEHSSVLNGASDLMVEVFGDIGRHARTTLGVAALPLGAAVEVEGMFEVA